MVRPTIRPTLLPSLGAALALVLLAAPVAAGEVYQWKDANGVTHYSDAPPPDRTYQNRRINNRGATPVAAAPAPAENARCGAARAMLSQLQSEGPVGIDADDDGKPDSVLDPAQRAAQTRVAEAAIAANCTAQAEPPAS